MLSRQQAGTSAELMSRATVPARAPAGGVVRIGVTVSVVVEVPEGGSGGRGSGIGIHTMLNFDA